MTFHVLMTFSPTCQGRVVRFYVRGPSSSFLLLRRASTARARSQGSPPDQNSKLRIRVIPAGPEQQAQDQSDPPRTSTASAGSQCSVPEPNSNLWGRVAEWSLLDLNCKLHWVDSRSQRSPPDPNSNLIKVIPVGPQLQALDHSVPRLPAGP